ncbi:MAG TPA: hypothetical protein VGR72_07310 [Candidatus Acidoferrales bacterium]|nr:hypothetical protein [Candidatus Acidoferrales bacterium]
MAAALCIAGSLALVFRPGAYPPYWEGRDYVAIANGDYTHMESFYAGRVFHPIVVRIVATIAHIPVDWRAFLWVSAASLILFFCTLGAYFGIEFPSRPWLCIPLIATATVMDQYRNYYWHDLFYAALCAIFFLALRANRWASLPILFLLFMTRESTIMLVIALVTVAAVRRQWLFSASSLVVGVAGFKTTAALVARALPGHHGIPVIVLDFLKLPFNFALNVCGLEFWTNTDAATIHEVPKWIVNLPLGLHLGNIHQIGYCGFFWQRPAELLMLLASAFGLLPLLACRALAHRRGRWLFRKFDYTIAFTYGGLMFVLTPLIGTLPSRYVLYAWPVFWILGAALVHMLFSETREQLEFVLLCVLASWVPALVQRVTGSPLRQPSSLIELSAIGLILSLAILAALYVRGYLLIKAALRKANTV